MRSCSVLPTTVCTICALHSGLHGQCGSCRWMMCWDSLQVVWTHLSSLQHPKVLNFARALIYCNFTACATELHRGCSWISWSSCGLWAQTPRVFVYYFNHFAHPDTRLYKRHNRKQGAHDRKIVCEWKASQTRDSMEMRARRLGKWVFSSCACEGSIYRSPVVRRNGCSAITVHTKPTIYRQGLHVVSIMRSKCALCNNAYEVERGVCTEGN